MAIETSTGTQQEAPKAAASGFTGATLNESTSAPSGGMDFLALSSRVGISRIDSTVEPYLEQIKKLVGDALNGVQLIRLERMSNCYAFQYSGPDGVISFFGIQFISPSDPISQNFYPGSMKLRILNEELRDRFKDQRIRLSDARVILGGYQPEMDRAYEMADTIVRTFQVTAHPEVKNAQITALLSNEFVADWRISEARATEAMLSPHGVRPRMDIGLTIKAKIRNDLGREFREFEADYRTLGVIGGYTEIRDREVFEVNGQRVMLYRPVFNVTVCNAIIPLEGIGAVLLAALAPTIYNTQFWARQWQDLSESQPNPGLLEENPENRGRPYILKDQEELSDFVRTYFAAPVIAIQFQDGRDSIPGFWRMAASAPEVMSTFINRLTNFFATDQENATNVELARQIEVRYDGAYGDPKGILHDSREIDFLHIAAKSGVASIDQGMRRTLLGGSENPTDRARLVQNFTNSFVPLWLDTVAVVNPDFVKWIVSKTEQRRLVITDPNASPESRPFGSFLDGFGSSSGVGSIVTSGITSRGLNLSSFWGN